MKRQVFNPYLPSYEYIPDGEPRVFGDRLHIFGSHDRFGGDDYCMNDYVSWSAPLDDLSDWKYGGIIFKKEQCPYNGNLYAPDAIEGIDGRYYLYFSAANSSIISVAVCDIPDGKYEYYGDVQYKDGQILGTKENDNFQFDPSILVDEDRVWLYSGSGQTSIQKNIQQKIAGLMAIELEQDMITIRQVPKIIMSANQSWKAPNFFEAASVRKINDYYYLVYSATNASGLNYCISKYPDKEFEYRGIIHSPSDVGLNRRSITKPNYPIGSTHGGLVNIKNKWYIFNHRMTNQTYFTRQGVAEEIAIERDGSIKQVEATSCGLNGGPLVGTGKYPAYIVCNLIRENLLGIRSMRKGPYVTQDGEDREHEPGQYITGIKKNDVIGFKYFSFDKGLQKISITIKGTAKGKVEVSLDEKGTSIICEIGIDGSKEWQSISGQVSSVSGVQPLYFKFKGKGSLSFLDFTLAE